MEVRGGNSNPPSPDISLELGVFSGKTEIEMVLFGAFSPLVLLRVAAWPLANGAPGIAAPGAWLEPWEDLH